MASDLDDSDEGVDEAGEVEGEPGSSRLEKPRGGAKGFLDDAGGCLAEGVVGEEGVQDERLYDDPGYDLVDEVSEEERDGNNGVGLEDGTEHLENNGF